MELYLNLNKTLMFSEIESGFGFNHFISGAAMTHLKDTLLLSGGINNDRDPNSQESRNCQLAAFDLKNLQLKILKPPNHLRRKYAVFGSSLISFGQHTLLFIGGSLPLPSHAAGRLIMLYSKESTVPLRCDIESCIFDPTCHSNPLTAECTVCGKVSPNI